MTSLPFSTLDLQKSDIDAIIDIFNNLKSNFNVAYDLEFSYDFSKLEVFSNRKINAGPAISINNNFQTFHLAFIQVGYSYAYATYYLPRPLTYEYQIWGISTLKTDFGHILIKPETLLDKIHELINPIEIDFDDDTEFSKKFYVVTTDELKTKLRLTKLFRTYIQNIHVNDFVIEIINNKLIVGNRKIIESESSLDFVNFMDKVSKFC